MDGNRRKAPWPDYRGADIFEGDTIIHPSGDSCVVVFILAYASSEADIANAWRVKYGDGDCLWLGNQIGDRGRACVLATKEAKRAEEDNCGECRFGKSEMFGIECRRRAPGFNQVPSHHDIRQFVPAFPVMKNEDWCGEFSREVAANG